MIIGIEFELYGYINSTFVLGKNGRFYYSNSNGSLYDTGDTWRWNASKSCIDRLLCSANGYWIHYPEATAAYRRHVSRVIIGETDEKAYASGRG